MATEIRPRWSNTRAENIALVSQQLQAAGQPVDAVEFAHLVTVLSGTPGSAGHPIDAAADALRLSVHWVN